METYKEVGTDYIAMWDMNGLECLFNVSKEIDQHEAHEKAKVWNTLKGVKTPDRKSTIPLQQMIIRARYNSQRQYEIYQFVSNMDEDDIKDVFENSPQTIVNFIRKHGQKIYSDYIKQEERTIV